MVIRWIGVSATLAVAALSATLAWLALAHGGAALGLFEGPLPALALELGVTPLGAAFCALLAPLAAAVALWSARRGQPAEALLIAAFSAAMLLVLCAQSSSSRGKRSRCFQPSSSRRITSGAACGARRLRT